MKVKDFIATMFNSKSKKGCGLHFTVNHNGKMSGMYSLSTTCKHNKLCICRINSKNKKLVCKYCFSDRQQKRMTTMIKPLLKNMEILENIIDYDLLPIINAYYFRFEAFGDLFCTNQVINYFNICYKNPKVNFALWTKNPWFIKWAIESGYKKPDNLNIVFSSLFLNEPVKKNIVSRYDFIDKVFTVYDDEQTAIKNGVVINCGSKNCISCGLCYEKNNVKYINELKK